METYANGIVDDEMISSLSFKIDPTANYVTDRKSVTYQASGSNIYTAGGGSVVKFTLSGSGQYLDPSTVRFVYTLVNKDVTANHSLYPLSGPWSFFRRCRIYSGTAVIEDIDYSNKVHEMFSLLTGKHARDNDCNVEGFGDTWTTDEIYYANHNTSGANPVKGILRNAIPNGKTRTVSFKPLFGILNQPKFIPLQWLPLTMEFELVTDSLDPIIQSTGNGLSQFEAGNTSTNWEIKDCFMKADVIELDSAVHNEYASHLMNGNPIPINYTSFITQVQTVGDSNIGVNITRSASRLKTIFLSFSGTYPGADAEERTRQLMRKDWNSFFHPMMLDNLTGRKDFDYTQEVEVQVLVGNKTFPIFPIRSASEAFSQLKKALGVHGSSFHSFSIDDIRKYCSDHFIIGIDTEKVLGASFSGINCRQDLITIKGKPANGNAFTRNIGKIWITLQADYVVEIRETGSLVID